MPGGFQIKIRFGTIPGAGNFYEFGTDLDKTTRAQLTRGERMVEIFKTVQYEPLEVAKQVIIIYSGTNGYLDDYQWE